MWAHLMHVNHRGMISERNIVSTDLQVDRHLIIIKSNGG